MQILAKTVVFLTVLLIFGVVCPQDQNNISRSINYSAQPVEDQSWRCPSLEKSYKENVFKARHVIIKEKYKDAANRYKEHLRCWDDKEIYIELGELYESQEKYFLAGIAYKKGNAEEKLTRVIEKQAQFINANENNDFEILSLQISDKFLKKHKEQTFFRNAFFIIGPIALATGLGLFIHDKAGGENSLTAQYTLMLGGMSLISGGFILNAVAKDSLRISQAYGVFSQSFKGDGGTTPDEFFVNSGIDAKTRKALAVSYRKNGIGLMLMSIPMFALAIYGFFDSYDYILRKNDDDKDDESWDPDFVELDIFVGHLYQILSLAPAILSLTGGIVLLAKASKYEKLSTEPSLLTLNSIAPIINPVSKTYGLALGFSF